MTAREMERDSVTPTEEWKRHTHTHTHTQKHTNTPAETEEVLSPGWQDCHPPQTNREREREIDRGGDIERETERPTKKDRESGR